MKVEQIDHIHIVVKDIEKATKFFETVFGIKFTGDMQGENTAKDWHVRTRMASVGSASFELIQPTSPDSPMAKFIERRGEGLQAISLKVDDLEAAKKEMQTRGIRLVGTVKHGSLKEAQFHPKDTFGVLFELCEYPAIPGAVAATHSEE